MNQTPETADLTDDELDRLADYTADLLDGDEATQVARLVEADPRWAAAHASLVSADALIRDELRQAGREPLVMPADVSARVDEALGAQSSRHLSVVGGTPTVTRSRKRFLSTAVAAVAAAVVIVAGVGLIDTFERSSNLPTAATDLNRGGSGSGADSESASAPSVPPAVAAATPFLASGSDYTVTTLQNLVNVSTAYQAPAGALSQADDATKSVPRSVRDAAPGALVGLTDESRLATCLEAVLAGHPGVVTLLDYARYGGAAALLIVVRQGLTSTVVAVGADCGTAGPDEKVAVTVP